MTKLSTIFTVFFVLLGLPLLADEDENARILAIGDSLMAWHSLTGQSIPAVLSDELDEPVVNRSVSGARLLFKVPLMAQAGMEISSQYVEGDWDWVILNGGGNDLWFGCGCHQCDAKLDKLIMPSGTEGAIPELISDLRQAGSQVLFFGYLRSPGVGSLIEDCKEPGDELEARIADFAKKQDGVYFLSNADLVPDGDLSFHGLDRIHPSIKASRAIGERLADIIRKNDETR